MFTLSRILEIDAAHHGPATLPQCLGDSWLYDRNDIYRRIRDEFTRIGGQYTDSDRQLCGDYNVLSLLCLPDLLSRRTIPVTDNTALLKRLARERPDFNVTGTFLSGALRHNFLLHESAHCIAHAVLSGMPSVGNGHADSAGERSVLEALIGESFALAAERTAWTLADSPTHMLFYSLNSYTGQDRGIRRVADEAISLVGMATAFRLAFVTFFFLNTGTAAPDESATDSFIELATGGDPLPASAGECLRKAVKDALRLSEAFRGETTPTYFRLLGYEQEFTRFIERRVDAARMHSLGLTEVLDRLAPLAVDAGSTPSLAHAATK